MLRGDGILNKRGEANYVVPTGYILVVRGRYGLLECLSLGDYGKDVNLSGKPVKHTKLLPLEEKWVATLSTQYGCSMGCSFCDVPKVGTGLNATIVDLNLQMERVLGTHPEIDHTDRLNVHYARMGEPTWNHNVLAHAISMASWRNLGYAVHPVVSTMMPKHNRRLELFLRTWCETIKNGYYGGNAGLQLSINSTNKCERDDMFGGHALELEEIAFIFKNLPKPRGRKYTLNFAVCGYEVDPDVLRCYFDPRYFICKLTPMHKTTTAIANNIKTVGDYTTPEPYETLADDLRSVGYEVLVFIASREEDEGRITCGNAILSGTRPFDFNVMKS